MKRRIAEKFIFFVMTLFILVSLNFVIFRVLAPYDPSKPLLKPPGFPYISEEWLRRQFGSDQPLFIRYVMYIIDMFTLNFGYSFVTRHPVTADLWRYLPYTLLLFVPAFIFIIMASVPMEIYSLTRKRGTLKMKLLAVSASLFTSAIPAKKRLINTHLEDYILLRRAMGFDERTTLYKLIFTNTFPLIATVMAFSIPYLIMGTIIAEHLFSLRGIGRWYTQSLMAQDLPVQEALLFVYQILTVSTGFLISLISYDSN